MFFYFSALLGSTFGMMESFALIMGFVECFLDSIENRRNRRIFAIKTQNIGVMLSSFMKTKLKIHGFTVHDISFEKIDKKENLSS